MSQVSFISLRAFNQEITIFATEDYLVQVEDGIAMQQHENTVFPILLTAKQQLIEYFNMERKSFDIPLDFVHMTQHQQRVYEQILDIPYGETVSYKDIADEIGSSAIAVGQACKMNPVPYFVPCHRVISANGSLGGFKGGMEEDDLTLKEQLLNLERNNC